ncbi:MAG: biotin/lipoyl-binding protein [Chloroflexi bacterium]|nr:biotin/lipoyl-binding protein [Chloroflexota bacterium]
MGVMAIPSFKRNRMFPSLKPGRWLAVLVAAAVVAGGGVYTYQKLTAKAAAPAVQTGVAQRANIQASVTSSGTVAAIQTASLSFDATGKVQEVYVAVGDTVQRGAPLAKVDERTLNLKVKQTEIAVHTAQLNYDTLTAGAKPEDLASAAAQVESARQKLATLESQGAAQDVAAAEASVLSAQTKLDALKNPSAGDLATAQSALTTAQAKLDALKNPAAGDLATAQSAVTSAQAKLDALRNPSAGGRAQEAVGGGPGGRPERLHGGAGEAGCAQKSVCGGPGRGAGGGAVGAGGAAKRASEVHRTEVAARLYHR